MEILGAVLEHTPNAPPFAESRPLTIGPLSLDDPGPGEILIRVEAAGVCHSDLSVVDGNRLRPTPMLLGHESAGRIERIGAGVSGLEKGDRVVTTFLPRCGSCPECGTNGRLPCRVGSAANAEGTLVGGQRRLHRGGAQVQHHLGISAFATHAVVSRTSVVKVEDDVPADVAALLGCAVLTGGGAVLNSGRPRPGERVVVVGLGGVGMAALAVAVALGHEVIGVDPVPLKRAAALGLRASAALDPEKALLEGILAPVVIEAAGSVPAFETALALTAPGGTTVTVGLPAPEAMARISPLSLTAGARTVVGSYLGSAVPERDIPRYVALWREGRLPLESLVSARITLPELNVAMDRLAAGQELRQLVVFEEKENL